MLRHKKIPFSQYMKKGFFLFTYYPQKLGIFADPTL